MFVCLRVWNVKKNVPVNRHSKQTTCNMSCTNNAKSGSMRGIRIAFYSSVNFPFPFTKCVEHDFTALSTCMRIHSSGGFYCIFTSLCTLFPLQRSSITAHTCQALLVDLLCVAQTSAQIWRCRETKWGAKREMTKRAHAQRHRNAYRKIRTQDPVIYVKS